MANAFQVKTDVVNELRNRLYYNQMEIQRLINNPGLISHKEVVKTVIDYLKLNVEAQSSIELIEAYLPAPAPQVQQPESEPIVNEGKENRRKLNDNNGVKKID